MERKVAEPSFEEIAYKQRVLLEQADRVRSGEERLSFFKKRSLGREALSLAEHQSDDSPAQGEAFLVNMASSIGGRKLIKGTEAYIKTMHQDDSAIVAQESLAILRHAIKGANEPHRTVFAAIDEAHNERFGVSLEDSLHRMKIGDAEKNARVYNREAEPLSSDGVSQHEAYDSLGHALEVLDTAKDDFGKEVASDEIREIAGTIAAQVIEKETVKPLLAIAVDYVDDVFEEAGEQRRNADPLDVLLIESAVVKLQEADKTPKDILSALDQMARTIEELLPPEDQAICEEALKLAASEGMTPLEAVEELREKIAA